MPKQNDIQLYSKKQVFVATFLGSILAGTVLMYLNSKRLKPENADRKILLIGIASTIILIAFCLFSPYLPPSITFPVLQAVAAGEWYKWAQESQYKQALAQSGKKCSWEKTILVLILCVILFFAVGIALLLPLVIILPENFFPNL